MIRGNQGSGSRALAGAVSGEQSDSLRDGTQAEDSQSVEPTTAPVEILDELQAVFGENRIVRNIGAKDPRLPSGLAAVGDPNSDAAQSLCNPVRSRLDSTGHLVAMVCYRGSAMQVTAFPSSLFETFSVKPGC